ncbi:MAG: DMT family transporter [Candidatus Micrarchaeia archaeon]
MEKINKTALVYLLGVSLFYGLLIVIQKMGLNFGIDPLLFSFLRSLIIIPLSIILFFPQLKKLRFVKKHKLGELFILGVASSIGILVLFFGQNMTTAVNAGFLIRLTPLFVIPFSYILLKEKPSNNSIFFMFVMLVGAFLLTTNGKMETLQLGDLLIFFVAGIVAFQNVLAKRIMRNVPTDVVIFFRIFISSILIILIVPVFLKVKIEHMNYEYFGYITITAILYILSVICQYRAIKLVGPFITTTLFLIGSLFSAGFAYLLLGETLSLVQWLGASAILIGGIFLIKKYNNNNNKPEKSIEI